MSLVVGSETLAGTLSPAQNRMVAFSSAFILYADYIDYIALPVQAEI